MTSRENALPPELELGRFARGVAHEVANPLNAVLMNVGLARMLYERGDMARVSDVLERLNADCARFEKLIRGLQRFGAGLRPLQRDTVSAAELVANALEAIGQGKAIVHTDLEPVAVDGDARVLERVLAGILQNSLEAGATAIDLRVRRDADGSIRLIVADDGEGIAVESRGKVSDPFYSTRHSDGNVGLGLTLAQEALRLHGGALAFETNEPRGVRVTMRLPPQPAKD